MDAAGARDAPPAGARRLSVGDVRFQARARVLSPAPDRSVIVVVLRETDVDEAAAARELRRRYGLTAREAEVALLLADRRTSKEIARLLGITIHTAMRHTEKVLGKLGLGCRRHVAGVVAGATGTAPTGAESATSATAGEEPPRPDLSSAA